MAKTMSAVRFTREAHEKIPSEGFDLLMRRDNVMDVEVYLALYDMQDLRDWLYQAARPYVLNLVFHAWLFPELKYREEGENTVEVAFFGGSGVFAVADVPEGVAKIFRKFPQSVFVRDKVYMCMGPDNVRIRVDRHRLVCSFWSLCVPAGEERAIATKHVLINETRTHISKEVGAACGELGDAAVADVLRHMQALLKAVQNATHRLSKLMGRCESAFEGVFLGRGDCDATVPFHGSTDPMEVWEEQLALLDRSVTDGQTLAQRPAPLLSDMLRRRVYEDLGRPRRTGKIPPDDEESITLGHQIFATTTAASGSDRAQAIHRVLIECIHDLERLAEISSEMLAVPGVTA